jgi:Nitroreductase family
MKRRGAFTSDRRAASRGFYADSESFPVIFHVARATLLCCTCNIEHNRNASLDAILGRRAIRAFDSVVVAPEVREQILRAACAAPSSFNIQPYRLIWIETLAVKKRAAELCMGQAAAVSASVLVVAVADVGSWKSTAQADAGSGNKRTQDCRRRKEIETGEMVFHAGMV